MITSLIKGFIVGMGASIPLGPIGVMCVQKTLGKGRNTGFITGLGAAVVDTLFAALAILGLAYIQKFIDYYENHVLLFGGLIVALFGLKIFLTNPVKQIRMPKGNKRHHLEGFFSAIVMSLTNPGTVFLILGMFAFVKVNTESQMDSTLSLTLWGVFLGAATWWFILSTSINIFRKRFRLRQLLIINRLTGIIIMVLGLISFFEGVWRFSEPFFS